MSDQSIDIPMQAETRSAKKPTTEFQIYFGIIFLATLPLATLTWALSVIRSGSLSQRGPIARAWSQARIITPMIFSA
ncbi:MAG: cytochrome PufQ [Boseongicola sp.]|nr:cytochrome PufQ [Boseongicola sp.]MDD9976629.1 cytochrome PufQ [Boseongicola sp.]